MEEIMDSSILTKQGKAHAMTILLPPQIHQLLIYRAKCEGRPKAQMARRLIEEGLRDKKSAMSEV